MGFQTQECQEKTLLEFSKCHCVVRVKANSFYDICTNWQNLLKIVKACPHFLRKVQFFYFSEIFCHD